ncbi:MAG: MBL fold metallo-hydrolase [Betaproteobacteria bacterium]|nr:MBL fold metallo-hydrolase [Betaproteobacteria bacterium]
MSASAAPQVPSSRIATVAAPASFDHLSYPHPDHPAPGTVREVAPGVHWVRMPLPFALDHINLWLLEESDGWTIVDCGYAADATREHWERLFRETMGGRPVKRIVVTHYHPDHLGLAAWIVARFGVPLYMSQAEYLTAHAVHAGVAGHHPAQILELFRRHGLQGERFDALVSRGNAYQRGVPEVPTGYFRIMDGDVMEINGRAWRVIMGYGHAPEHAALYCEDLRVLISGDMVLPKISTNVSVWAIEPDGNPLKLFLDSLARYGALPSDTLVLPSHGRVFHGLHPRVRELDVHHEQRLGELTAACGEPRMAEELIEVLFRRDLDAHQTFFAIGETVAHLNFLMYREVLERIEGEDGRYRFVRKRSALAEDYPDVL